MSESRLFKVIKFISMTETSRSSSFLATTAFIIFVSLVATCFGAIDQPWAVVSSLYTLSLFVVILVKLIVNKAFRNVISQTWADRVLGAVDAFECALMVFITANLTFIDGGPWWVFAVEGLFIIYTIILTCTTVHTIAAVVYGGDVDEL